MSARAGLGQRERLPRALAPHYFDVDELSLAQLMTLALDYAGMVRFAEAVTPLHAADTWRAYFAVDETMVLADILATRLDGVRARFELQHFQLFSAVAGSLPVAFDQLPTSVLHKLGSQLDRWSQVLLANGSPVGIDLGALVGGVRARMTPQLTLIDAWCARQDNAALVSPVSHLAELAATLQLADAAGSHELLRASLKSWFGQLVKGIDMVQRAAAERIDATFKSGLHDPGVGLLLAFVQLYRQAQARLNRLTERHLDFYYHDVLRMRAHGPERDTTFLVFQASSPGTSVTVAAGSEFLAPFDRLQPELTFTSAHEVVVSDGRVRATHTLFCERNPLTSPENGLLEMRHGVPTSYPTACYLTTLPALEPDAALATARLAPHPLFGAPRTSGSSAGGKAARLGFAFASNVLLMQDGERRVHVALALGSDIQAAAAGGDATLAQRLQSLAALLRVSDADVRYKVLRRMLTLSVSSATGWLAIASYSAEFTPGGATQAYDTLHLHFIISAAAPPIVAYDAALHHGGYACDAPLLRCVLNNEGYLYPYGLLRGLPLIQADIEVSVNGHRALALQNHIGQLSVAAPFLPFGPLPAAGAYLIVGSAEVACKRVTSADLVLEWGGLPSAAGGFRAYYGAYDGEQSFDHVQCALSVLADGQWQPADLPQRPLHTLFAPDLATRRHAIAPTETISLRPVLHLARPRPQLRPDLAPSLSYVPGTKDGFFKLTLAGPEFAFGHRDYPFALATALTNNSQPGRWRRVRDLPNPPYTPLIDALLLNYRAHASIRPGGEAGREAMLRLHPLGWEQARSGPDGADLLLPQLDYAGNLYLGLEATDLSAALTLFFHLVEDALPRAALARAAPVLHWSYLTDNRWQALPTHAVRADSTNAFLRPGIITIKLPADITCDNTVMPAGLYWVRVSADTGLPAFCSLYSVHAHAAQVWRQLDAAPAPGTPAVIAAGVIVRPRHAIAGLGRITQMSNSSGGRLAENATQLRRRVAERLRHKGRAISADDYERLILQQFPQVDRVKCFPNLSVACRPDGGACPGHVLIVALPPFASQGHLAVLPRLNGELIRQVADFISARSSAAVTLEVVNPAYQRIQVRCKVKLAPGVDTGWQVNRLADLVSDFISPWSSRGNTSHFGWCIRQHDLESLLLAQVGVLGVSEFSMLSISDQAGDRFALADTAVPRTAGHMVPDITPAVPWSIAVPIKRHVMAVAGDEHWASASRTGIGKLEIGSTFIISTGEADAETQ